ncbi:hypothetical protein Tco_0086008 [Tanacetum coccineum]
MDKENQQQAALDEALVPIEDQFVSKGEEHQKYGMSIPDSIMNDEIRNSIYYMTYLAFSTNIEVPKAAKGKGKGVVGKKKPDTHVHKGKKKAAEKKKDAVADTSESGETEDDEVQPVKLKGIEILSEAAQYESDMKKAAKASKRAYRLQQQSKGSSEGSGVIPEVPDEPKDISARMEQAGDEQLEDDQAVIKQAGDTTEKEIQLMVDVHIQEDPAIQRTPLVDTVISMYPEKTTTPPPLTPTTTQAQITNVSESDPSATFEQRFSKPEKKNQINLFKPSSSSTSADSFSELELKKILYDRMQKSGSFLDHDKNLDLYNALMNSMGLDEAITRGELDLTKVLNQSRRDDEDQDPLADSEKEKKRKRKRKDSEPSKDKDTADASKKSKSQSQPSNTNKSMQAEETVEEPVQEMAMDAED